MLIDDLTCLLSAEQVVSLSPPTPPARSPPGTKRTLSVRVLHEKACEKFQWTLSSHFQCGAARSDEFSTPSSSDELFGCGTHTQSTSNGCGERSQKWLRLKIIKSSVNGEESWWNTDSRILALYCILWDTFILDHHRHRNWKSESGGFMQKSHPFSRHSFHNIEVRHDDWTR